MAKLKQSHRDAHMATKTDQISVETLTRHSKPLQIELCLYHPIF